MRSIYMLFLFSALVVPAARASTQYGDLVSLYQTSPGLVMNKLFGAYVGNCFYDRSPNKPTPAILVGKNVLVSGMPYIKMWDGEDFTGWTEQKAFSRFDEAQITSSEPSTEPNEVVWGSSYLMPNTSLNTRWVGKQKNRILFTARQSGQNILVSVNQFRPTYIKGMAYCSFNQKLN